ncbi:MAG TPA: DUF169 domain-containing protein [Syntrophales bacterium]|nr:DUF169 domain-containing protein [Syntrophales bacterium]
MEWKNLCETVDRYVKPLTFPVAVAVLDRKEAVPKARTPLSAFGHSLALCQGIALARRFGWKIAFHEEDWGCAVGMSFFGFGGKRPPEMDGEIACPLYTETPEGGISLQNAMPQLPQGKAQTIIIAGGGRADFDPDVAVIYGMPSQIARCVQGALWQTGEPVASSFPGRANCGYEIILPIVTGRYQVILPGGGERAFAGTQDFEMSFAVPKSLFGSFARGLEESHRAGANRVPTPALNILCEPAMPPQYDSLARFLGKKK